MLKNMDELFEIDIPDNSLAACHACVCNPRRLSHYPPSWYHPCPFALTEGSHEHVRIRISPILLQSKKECRLTSRTVSQNSMADYRYSNPQERNSTAFIVC